MAMKEKQHSLAAAITAGLTLGANALFAQSLPGPNGPKPRLELLEQTQPTTPWQVTQALPEPEQLAGQRGTIPERVPSPESGSQKEMVISSEDIRRAQEALKGKGFDPGAISGRMHAGTQEALREFQTANDLPATGVLDQKTADKLGIKLSGSTSQQGNRVQSLKLPLISSCGEGSRN
jgi:peptidoglycan hydrolase-like protein with peptidoglycan-binding domain